MKTEKSLTFKWTVSRGRETYGWNICSLYVDRVKVSSTCGGGYDMAGTVLGNWIQDTFSDRLMKTRKKFYGMIFLDPKPVHDRPKHRTDLPTKHNTAIHIDGACGINCMWAILEHLGYKKQYLQIPGKNADYYSLEGDEI